MSIFVPFKFYRKKKRKTKSIKLLPYDVDKSKELIMETGSQGQQPEQRV